MGRLRRWSSRRWEQRRHVAYVYPTTEIQTAPEQPAECNGTRLKRGREGCCAGRVYDLMTTSCCGQVPFYFTSLSCCAHGDGTATLYDPYAQNCCDDPAKKNVERGICELEGRETSCCTLEGGGRRRRHHRQHHRARNFLRHAHEWRE